MHDGICTHISCNSASISTLHCESQFPQCIMGYVLTSPAILPAYSPCIVRISSLNAWWDIYSYPLQFCLHINLALWESVPSVHDGICLTSPVVQFCLHIHLALWESVPSMHYSGVGCKSLTYLVIIADSLISFFAHHHRNSHTAMRAVTDWSRIIIIVVRGRDMSGLDLRKLTAGGCWGRQSSRISDDDVLV